MTLHSYRVHNVSCGRKRYQVRRETPSQSFFGNWRRTLVGIELLGAAKRTKSKFQTPRSSDVLFPYQVSYSTYFLLCILCRWPGSSCCTCDRVYAAMHIANTDADPESKKQTNRILNVISDVILIHSLDTCQAYIRCSTFTKLHRSPGHGRNTIHPFKSWGLCAIYLCSPCDPQ